MGGIAGGEGAKSLLESMEHRGESIDIIDAGLKLGTVPRGNIAENDGILVADSDLLNPGEAKTESYSDDDVEILLSMAENDLGSLDDLEGGYAFAHAREGRVTLARDVLGLKPLFYSEEPFAFASERQALENSGLKARELHPRNLLVHDLETGSNETEERSFFSLEEGENSLEENAERIKELLLESVERRVSGEIALLFSGGLDSTLIAACLDEIGADFTCYTAGIQHGNVKFPEDVEWARNVADEMGLDLEVNMASIEEVERAVPQIVGWISSTSVVKIGVSLPSYFALRGEEETVFSGLGSEQLYAGYTRMGDYLNRECLSGLRSLYHKDLYRDNVLCSRKGSELRLPFLDKDLVKHALSIPPEQKVGEGYRKLVLRRGAELFDVPEGVVWRKKRAAQYGSNFDKALSRIAREGGFESKQDYLNSLSESPNARLGALTSGGKDSNAAMYRSLQRNNEIECLLNVQSGNEESYMFDQKDKHVVEGQAEMLGLPLLVGKTEGEKEKELEDLRELVSRAVERYEIEGVVCGALASSYQKERVERIGEELGLEVHAPLWQEDQENYLRWLVKTGFEVKITRVAARGLDASWEERVLDDESVEEMIRLSREHGFNAAGEGGEYETVVLDSPLFGEKTL